MSTITEASVADLCHFAAVAAREVVTDTARETHGAVAGRVFDLLEPRLGPPASLVRACHDAVAATVHTSVRLGVGGAAAGLKATADAGIGPALEAGAKGRFVRSALNGLVGERFAEEDSPLALTMAVRAGGADVPFDGLADAFPTAGAKVAVLLHGLCEDETCWAWRTAPGATSTVEVLVATGWTPVLLRANTGLPVLENGAVLAALLRDLVASWPVEVERLALIGHSLGGLVHRAACAVAVPDAEPWTDLVTDVVTLGTPHLGAPIARGITRGSGLLARLPETAAFGRVLDLRSAGVCDLARGLPEVAAPDHIRLRLVSATLTRSPDHPVARWLGDLLVQVGSAQPDHAEFVGADRLHVPVADHFDLLNHPRVHEALRAWLA